jgi:hypothetical protein
MQKAAVEVRAVSVFGYEADKTPGSLLESGSLERLSRSSLPSEARGGQNSLSE